MGLEYCPNGELYTQLQERGPLPLPDVVQYAAEVVDILAYLRCVWLLLLALVFLGGVSRTVSSWLHDVQQEEQPQQNRLLPNSCALQSFAVVSRWCLSGADVGGQSPPLWALCLVHVLCFQTCDFLVTARCRWIKQDKKPSMTVFYKIFWSVCCMQVPGRHSQGPQAREPAAG